MKQLLTFLFFFFLGQTVAQENLDYQKPPKLILDLVDVQLPPTFMMDDMEEYMVLRSREAFETIARLSEKEMRLAGLRINPKTNIGSRTYYYNNLKVKNLKSGASAAKQVEGLPSNPQFTFFSWSPDQSKIAMTHTIRDGVEVWVLDLGSAKITKLTEARVNANLRDPINWFEDGKSLLVKMVPQSRKELIDAAREIPTGPTISVNDGKKAQNRTYQDLLQNPNDEFNFKQLAMSEIYKIGLDGKKEKWLPPAMYSSISFSPDGNYVMVSTVEMPFSYLVPYYRFPSTTRIYDKSAKEVSTIVKVPLIEDLPKGFMAVRKGRRNINWRDDKASTLIYAVALDEGDPEKEVSYRDEVFQLETPFKGEGKSLIMTENRFSNIEWGNDNIAIAEDYWWNNRNTKSYVFNPSDPSQKPKIIFDRNYQDRYSDPGYFVMERNEMGSYVLAMEGDEAFLLGAGYTAEGQFPFLDKMNLQTQNKSRLYTSEYKDKLESLREFKPKEKKLLVRIESPNEYPNYYFRKLGSNKLTAVTNFENPFKGLQSAHKEVISYKRDDGLELSGTLYLPVGYDQTKKEKRPMILWAYPREFKDKNSASQKTQNPNQFTYPSWASPVLWLSKGYVVLDRAAFPIVGEGDDEPNDNFRKQLVSNARAAIDAVDNLGYIDRDRVAVGGHSYGAFMVANLLSHSDLFAAGIARSGAYNRTLTPFGFQSEERNYWEAPQVYYNMSPFMHSEKMKTPLLLIHGEADNNSGTYPLQSKRYFNALKGLGATVRLVMLPKESHGYRAKESVYHVLWEQDQWLEKYLHTERLPSSEIKAED
jgi:dipeptidyl aminopeptidase/acylaminoacyl peptidase